MSIPDITINRSLAPAFLFVSVCVLTWPCFVSWVWLLMQVAASQEQETRPEPDLRDCEAIYEGI